jgi:hypothetical protein
MPCSASENARSVSAECLPGQYVGVTEIADDIWLVSFMDYDLGFFDNEVNRVEPTGENPFAPKVLSMCPEWTLIWLERETGIEPATSSLGK